MKILVIEDEPVDLKLAMAVLKTHDHAVHAQNSGKDAVSAACAEKPDLILLDLRLPGMDGLTLARQLKENPETSDIPIVAMTAFTDRFRKEEALKAGCAAYLTKPIDTRTLSLKIVSAAKKRSERP